MFMVSVGLKREFSFSYLKHPKILVHFLYKYEYYFLYKSNAAFDKYGNLQSIYGKKKQFTVFIMAKLIDKIKGLLFLHLAFYFILFIFYY